MQIIRAVLSLALFLCVSTSAQEFSLLDYYFQEPEVMSRPQLKEHISKIEFKDFQFYDQNRKIMVKMSRVQVRDFVHGLVETYLHSKISKWFICLDSDDQVTAIIGGIIQDFANTFDERNDEDSLARKCYTFGKMTFEKLWNLCGTDDISEAILSKVKTVIFTTVSVVFAKITTFIKILWHSKTLYKLSVAAYHSYLRFDYYTMGTYVGEVLAKVL